MVRINLFLICAGCNDRKKRHQNYRTSKAKKPQGEKLILNKYCKFCQKTVEHKEGIINNKQLK